MYTANVSMVTKDRTEPSELSVGGKLSVLSIASLSEAHQTVRAVAFYDTYNLSQLSISNSTINFTGNEATFGIWPDTHCSSVQGFHLNFKEL